MHKTNHKNRINKVSEELYTSTEDVEMIISLYYESMYTKLESVKEDPSKIYTEEEFNKVFKSVLMPGIGTFKPSYRKYLSIKEKLINKE